MLGEQKLLENLIENGKMKKRRKKSGSDSHEIAISPKPFYQPAENRFIYTSKSNLSVANTVLHVSI